MLPDPELTPEEQKFLRKTLDKRERFAEAWPRLRYACLFSSIFALSVCVWGCYMSYRLSIAAGDDLLMRIRAEGMMVVQALVFGLGGVQVLIATLVRWNRHKMDMVFVKIGRSLLEKGEGIPDVAGRPLNSLSVALKRALATKKVLFTAALLVTAAAVIILLALWKLKWVPARFNLAVREGDSATIHAILKSRPELAEIRDRRGRLPLGLAVLERQKGSVQALLEAGADPNGLDARKATPLHYAAACGYDKIAVLLISGGSDVSARTANNSQPIHDAFQSCTMQGIIRVIRVLIANGADVNTRGTADDLTPLHLAMRERDKEFLLMLVDTLVDAGADVNVCGGLTGGTVLHEAVACNDMAAAKALLKAGADLSIRDDLGKTPIDLAASQEMIDLLEHQRESQATQTADSPSREAHEE